MMGAAVATVIGQLLTAVLALWYLLNMRHIKPARSDYRMSRKVAGKTLVLGICSFLSQISLVAAMAAINNMIRKYGAMDAIFAQEQYAQIPMAVVGIVMKFFQIVISIVVGMAAGCIPVVGFNIGAGLKAAASTALSMIREVVFGVGFALLLPIFFGLDGVLYSMPTSDILTFAIALFLIRKTYKELTIA